MHIRKVALEITWYRQDWWSIPIYWQSSHTCPKLWMRNMACFFHQFRFHRRAAWKVWWPRQNLLLSNRNRYWRIMIFRTRIDSNKLAKFIALAKRRITSRWYYEVGFVSTWSHTQVHTSRDACVHAYWHVCVYVNKQAHIHGQTQNVSSIRKYSRTCWFIQI